MSSHLVGPATGQSMSQALLSIIHYLQSVHNPREVLRQNAVSFCIALGIPISQDDENLGNVLEMLLQQVMGPQFFESTILNVDRQQQTLGYLNGPDHTLTNSGYSNSPYGTTPLHSQTSQPNVSYHQTISPPPPSSHGLNQRQPTNRDNLSNRCIPAALQVGTPPLTNDSSDTTNRSSIVTNQYSDNNSTRLTQETINSSSSSSSSVASSILIEEGNSVTSSGNVLINCDNDSSSSVSSSNNNSQSTTTNSIRLSNELSLVKDIRPCYVSTCSVSNDSHTNTNSINYTLNHSLASIDHSTKQTEQQTTSSPEHPDIHNTSHLLSTNDTSQFDLLLNDHCQKESLNLINNSHTIILDNTIKDDLRDDPPHTPTSTTESTDIIRQRTDDDDTTTGNHPFNSLSQSRITTSPRHTNPLDHTTPLSTNVTECSTLPNFHFCFEHMMQELTFEEKVEVSKGVTNCSAAFLAVHKKMSQIHSELTKNEFIDPDTSSYSVTHNHIQPIDYASSLEPLKKAAMEFFSECPVKLFIYFAVSILQDFPLFESSFSSHNNCGTGCYCSGSSNHTRHHTPPYLCKDRLRRVLLGDQTIITSPRARHRRSRKSIISRSSSSSSLSDPSGDEEWGWNDGVTKHHKRRKHRSKNHILQSSTLNSDILRHDVIHHTPSTQRLRSDCIGLSTSSSAIIDDVPNGIDIGTSIINTNDACDSLFADRIFNLHRIPPHLYRDVPPRRSKARWTTDGVDDCTDIKTESKNHNHLPSKSNHCGGGSLPKPVSAKDELLLQMPDHIITKTGVILPPTDSRLYLSKVVGVVWDKIHNSWVVNYTLLGRRYFQHFPAKKYGFLEGRQLAIELRLAKDREKSLVEGTVRGGGRRAQGPRWDGANPPKTRQRRRRGECGNDVGGVSGNDEENNHVIQQACNNNSIHNNNNNNNNTSLTTSSSINNKSPLSSSTQDHSLDHTTTDLHSTTAGSSQMIQQQQQLIDNNNNNNSTTDNCNQLSTSPHLGLSQDHHVTAVSGSTNAHSRQTSTNTTSPILNGSTNHHHHHHHHHHHLPNPNSTSFNSIIGSSSCESSSSSSNHSGLNGTSIQQSSSTLHDNTTNSSSSELINTVASSSVLPHMLQQVKLTTNGTTGTSSSNIHCSTTTTTLNNNNIHPVTTTSPSNNTTNGVNNNSNNASSLTQDSNNVETAINLNSTILSRNGSSSMALSPISNNKRYRRLVALYNQGNFEQHHPHNSGLLQVHPGHQQMLQQQQQQSFIPQHHHLSQLQHSVVDPQQFQ